MDEVEEIKHRIDIVDLISSYLTLKKAGTNYKAICPFHQEKTPSFMVSPEKQIFKCFGCNEGGDIFEFVMKMENLEFREALEMLAQRAGIQINRKKSFDTAPSNSLPRVYSGQVGTSQDKPDKKTRLYKINHLSSLVFHKILTTHPSGRPALEYLKKRKITLETIKDFVIGYAPAFAKATVGNPSQKVLAGFLNKKGFTASEIQAAGSPERFFKRIIFPIRDIMGNTIAFTGRVLDPKQEPASTRFDSSTRGGPKYLNTPDTIIFHKGRILYNLNQARGPIKQEKATVVVEGQMDAVASHQAGVKNVVATSGTALTDDHLKILYRYTPNIIFAFDADTAGKMTAKKAHEMAIQEGFNVKMVLLGEFKDPGEMIAANPPAGGPKLWQEAVKNAVPVIDWYFELAFENRKSKIENRELASQEKKEIAKEILPIIKIIPDAIEQAHYVNLLAKRLEVSENIVFDALSKVGRKVTSKPPVKIKKQLSSEELFLAILLYRPEKIAEVKAQVPFEDFKKPELSDIYKTLLEEYNISKEDTVRRLKSRASRQRQILIDNLILEAEKLYEVDRAMLDEDLRQAISHLRSDKKEALKTHYAQEINKAESAKDYERLKKLMREFQETIAK